MSVDEIKEIMKMLRAVVNGQSALKQSLMVEIKKNRDAITALDKKVDGVEARLTKRIDMQGSQLAELDDDAPTGQDFRSLEKRVAKVERRLASA